MDKRIIQFLNKCKVMTFATSHSDQPYCAHCFFAFNEQDSMLIFSSENDTRHIAEARSNNLIGGTINSENTSVAKLQGIQFTGTFVDPTEAEQQHMYGTYYKKYPFARAKPAPIWGVRIESIKMTDNTLGFGTKLHWNHLED